MEEYDEEQFKRVYGDYILLTNRLSEENDTLMLAAVLTTIGLSLYRTSLTGDDYDKMIDAIVSYKDQVKSFDTTGGYVN